MLVNETVVGFLEVLQSDAPAPGGGSVAALCGGLSAALTGMVAGLTIGKKKYVEVEEEMKKVAEATEAARKEFINIIDVDANSFNDYMAAMKMAKETDEEKATRAAAMEKAIQYAASVPESCAVKAAALFDMIELVVEKGNQNAITDGAVAAMMARSAVLGAALNVKINLGSIKDEAFSARLRKNVEELEKLAIKRESEILAKVVL
jgi:methenyltetrahydrofolate cyclohydrolase